MQQITEMFQNFQNFHPGHSILFGVGAGIIANKYDYNPYKIGGIVSLSSYLYMKNYGHTLPWKNNFKIEKENNIVTDDKKDEKQYISNTRHFDQQYYVDFDERLKYTLDKNKNTGDYDELQNFVKTHENDPYLPDEIYEKYNLVI